MNAHVYMYVVGYFTVSIDTEKNQLNCRYLRFAHRRIQFVWQNGPLLILFLIKSLLVLFKELELQGLVLLGSLHSTAPWFFSSLNIYWTQCSAVHEPVCAVVKLVYWSWCWKDCLGMHRCQLHMGIG